MPAQDIWRVEITNREEVGDVWHALESMVSNHEIYMYFAANNDPRVMNRSGSFM